MTNRSASHPPGDPILIVGGGPAGLTTAAAIAAHAPAHRDRIRVLERASYPRDKYCAGAIGQRGWTILERLGIAPDLPHQAVNGLHLLGARGDRCVRLAGAGRVVRRLEFDAAVAALVQAQGITIETGTIVDGVNDDADGLRVRLADNRMLQGAVVIGAEGIRSVVRRSMGLDRGRVRAQVIEADTEQVPSDRARDILVFDASDAGLRGYAWDFPTVVEGRDRWCRGMYLLHEPDAPATHLGERFAARLRRQGICPESVRYKRFAERGFEYGTPIAVGRRLLVGEAAGIDPISGEGIAQAIEYGELCGRFVANALTTGRPLDQWQQVFRASRLCRDLRVRRRLLPAFYGNGRADLEWALTHRPGLLDAGLHHFAGHRLQLSQRSRLVLGIGAGLAGVAWRRTLSGLGAARA